LLKMGLSQYGMGRQADAESTLAEVGRRYPGSDAARTAEDPLRAMRLNALRYGRENARMSTVAPPAAAAAAAAARLRTTEIFLSLQGEARDAGWPTVFVRLTGCPLRCTYCDTAHAFHGGEWRTFD